MPLASLLLILLLGLLPGRPPVRRTDFLTQQRAFPRVRAAEQAKGAALNRQLAAAGLRADNLQLLLVGYKLERELEVWAKAPADRVYRRLTTYPICQLSGYLGPKRARGDEQMPEGYYRITRFNPESAYHLSLGLDYPNAADRRASTATDLGGDIFLHGGCVTVGCLPLTDDKIRELYLLAAYARHNGQAAPPVYLFPLRLTAENMLSLQAAYAGDGALLAFWQNLKVGYDRFEATHQEIGYAVGAAGVYEYPE